MDYFVFVRTVKSSVRVKGICTSQLLLCGGKSGSRSALVDRQRFLPLKNREALWDAMDRITDC